VICQIAAPGREFVQQPGIHRPEEGFAGADRFLNARVVLAKPNELCSGEIGIDDQTGPLLDLALQLRPFETVADVDRPLALPDDGVAQRPAGLVPEDQRLSLVGAIALNSANVASLNVSRHVFTEVRTFS